MKNRVLEYIDSHLGLKNPPPSFMPEKENVDSKPWNEWAEEVVSENPGLALAGAFLIGVTIAWLIKRR